MEEITPQERRETDKSSSQNIQDIKKLQTLDTIFESLHNVYKQRQKLQSHSTMNRCYSFLWSGSKKIEVNNKYNFLLKVLSREDIRDELNRKEKELEEASKSGRKLSSIQNNINSLKSIKDELSRLSVMNMGQINDDQINEVKDITTHVKIFAIGLLEKSYR